MYTYHKAAIESNESKSLYEQLKSMVNPVKGKVMIFGQLKDEPRYKQFFSKSGAGYEYSHVESDSAGWPDVIQELANKAQSIVGCEQEFDSALINYYPDGKHYVGKHIDDDAMEGHIVSFSFGASRRFHIRDISTNKINDTIILEDGSAFVMNPGMQSRFKHELPVMSALKEGRVNVTLRQHGALGTNNKKRKRAPSMQSNKKLGKTINVSLVKMIH